MVPERGGQRQLEPVDAHLALPLPRQQQEQDRGAAVRGGPGGERAQRRRSAGLQEAAEDVVGRGALAWVGHFRGARKLADRRRAGEEEQ